MTDVRLPLWHMTADINHLMIKVSVALLVSSYSRCHLRQSDRDILHGSLILANCFALLQLSGILTAWLVCDSLKIIHVAFTNQQGSIYTLFPHLQVSGGFLVGHRRGDNLNPIYHLGLGASHASFILPPIFLGSPNFIISFLTVFGYEVS